MDTKKSSNERKFTLEESLALEQSHRAVLTADIEEALRGKPADSFAVAARQALQACELSTHKNATCALQVLGACVAEYYLHNDPTAARVLLFASGALISDELCEALLQTIRLVATPRTGSMDGK